MHELNSWLRAFCRQQDGPNLEILRGGYSLQHLQETKVYIEYLFISRVTLTVSFLPADWANLQSAALSRTANLGNLYPLVAVHVVSALSVLLDDRLLLLPSLTVVLCLASLWLG